MIIRFVEIEIAEIVFDIGVESEERGVRRACLFLELDLFGKISSKL